MLKLKLECLEIVNGVMQSKVIKTTIGKINI